MPPVFLPNGIFEAVLPQANAAVSGSGRVNWLASAILARPGCAGAAQNASSGTDDNAAVSLDGWLGAAQKAVDGAAQNATSGALDNATLGVLVSEGLLGAAQKAVAGAAQNAVAGAAQNAVATADKAARPISCLAGWLGAAQKAVAGAAQNDSSCFAAMWALWSRPDGWWRYFSPKVFSYKSRMRSPIRCWVARSSSPRIPT